MYDVHKSKGDHPEIFVMEMSDHHLLNTITAISNSIKKDVYFLRRFSSSNIISALAPRCYKESEEDAAFRIKNAHQLLKTYVLEASLRGLEISTLLAATYGRNKGISSLPTEKLSEEESLSEQLYSQCDLDIAKPRYDPFPDVHCSPIDITETAELLNS